MARFVYEEADRVYITLKAEPGEEIPTEMVAAWATIRTASALEYIGECLVGIDNSMLHLANAMQE